MTYRSLSVVCALAVLAGGCDSLVGAECAADYSVCDDVCVDTTSDPFNCGGCGLVCESGWCVAGECTGGLADAGVDDAPDAGQTGGPRDGGDGGLVDTGMADAGAVDDGVVCASSQVACGTTCVDTSSDDEHCGACFNACGSEEVCSTGLCCAPPESACGGQCVDMSSDPDNCGGCGVVCSSGICTPEGCLGGTAGHVIVIGHDYAASREGMNRLVGNSVFLATGPTVDVLVYEGDATDEAIVGTDAAIEQVAAETGRSWQRVSSVAAAVPALLTVNDVFVIYAQEGADDATLATLGAQWQADLVEFVDNGGVVVLMEGGGDHGGTFQILQAAGLFSAVSRTVAASPILSVVDPGNAIAIGVDNPYLGEATTVEIVTAEGTVVVESANAPVVVHKVFM